MSDHEANLNETLISLRGLITRHRWWLLGTAFLVPLVTIIVVFQLPYGYTSEATLVVTQPLVSRRYVEPWDTRTNAETVKTITRMILSGPRLLSIVDAFGLYPKERARLSPVQVVELMRKDVEVEPLDQVGGRGDITAFKVSFTTDNPRLAQEVTSRITSLFIEENLKERGAQAATTNKFLSEQLEAAKRKLAEQEQRLQDFKIRNSGDLPEQQQSNLAAVTDLRIQLQNVQASMNRAQQQRVLLESSLNGVVARLQTDRAVALNRYTPKHPEVLKKDQEIQRAQALLSSLKTGRVGIDFSADPSVVEDPAIAQIRSQAEALLAETENLPKEERRLRGEIGLYQGRLKLTPVKEQQLGSLLRDYDLFKKDYSDLVSKQLNSQLTANLEGQESGQNFRLVDPATLPAVPSRPKRFKISLGGAGAGIALGVALAFFMDIRKRSFHTEKELKRHFNAPIIAGVPLMLTTNETNARRLSRLYEWLAASAMLALVVAAEMFVFLHG